MRNNWLVFSLKVCVNSDFPSACRCEMTIYVEMHNEVLSV